MKLSKMIIRVFTSCLTIAIIVSCQAQESSEAPNVSQLPDYDKWQLNEDEWKEKLSDFEFYVLREKGTERAFSGKLWNNKKQGTYSCKACALPLFSSKTKYRSGTGWPSFYQPLSEDRVKEESDFLLGYERTEVMCGRCNGHLGHVFPDGPRPTGLRYCLNSVSLDFAPEEEAKQPQK